jgi:hypothetical protein
VDVGENDVVWRRHDIDGLLDVNRDRHKERLRQDEQPDRWRRRLQDDEIRWRRWQEKQRRWRWRRKVEFRVAEHQHRAVDIDDFLRRGWRHVVVENRE